MMGGLDPDLIDAAAAAKKVKPPRQPSELDIKKEERLAMKEQRMMERERGKRSATHHDFEMPWA